MKRERREGALAMVTGRPSSNGPAVPFADDIVTIGGRRWRRMVLQTAWLTDRDDLGAALIAALDAAPGAEPHEGDLVAVAEKVAVVTSGRMVDANRIRPGVVARLLARWVRPVGESRGLSVPCKMQFVLEEVGLLRVLAAAAAAAVTRPFGRHGAFYRWAGPTARDIDGLRGAYSGALLPPLRPAEAALLGHHLANRIGRPVAIVDVNDRGGTVRSAPATGPSDATILAVLADNPLGQTHQRTPVVLLRPL